MTCNARIVERSTSKRNEDVGWTAVSLPQYEACTCDEPICETNPADSRPFNDNAPLPPTQCIARRWEIIEACDAVQPRAAASTRRCSPSTDDIPTATREKPSAAFVSDAILMIKKIKGDMTNNPLCYTIDTKSGWGKKSCC